MKYMVLRRELSVILRISACLLYTCGICIILYMPDIEYRHGVDYKIICMHLPTSMLSYAILLRCIYLSSTYILCGACITDITMYYAGYITVLSSILTGVLWGWSQWGAIPWSDSKVSFMFVLLLYYQTTIVMYYVDKLDNYYLSIYTLYVLYHVPVLKYNVFWFTEIHQRASINLIDIYISSFTSYIIITYAGAFLYMLTVVFIYNSDYYYKYKASAT